MRIGLKRFRLLLRFDALCADGMKWNNLECCATCDKCVAAAGICRCYNRDLDSQTYVQHMLNLQNVVGMDVDPDEVPGPMAMKREEEESN